MCKMYVAIRREMLGSRETAWSLWTGKDVFETTAKNIKDMINAGKKVSGLVIGADGELALDTEGFYTTNIMEHRSAGNYKPMVEGDVMANLMYTVIANNQKNGKNVYECISNRFEQLVLDEQEVKTYIRMGIICSGAKLSGDKIIVAATDNQATNKSKAATEASAVTTVQNDNSKDTEVKKK